MRFLHPLILLAIPLVALFAAVAFAADARRRRALRLFANDSVLRRAGVALPESGMPLARLGIASVSLGLALAVVAAARPQWGKSDLTMKSRGGSILVALDVSRSMLARDVRPNRLERAKTDILDLVAELDGDRAGLLVFRHKGVMLCPLTTDYAFLRQAVDGISIDSAPRGETDIADALDKALEALEAAGEENCAIILISDGEDLAGRAKSAAEKAAKRGIPIFTVGLGDKSGATIETEDGGVLKFGNKVVETRLSEGTLRELASITGGAYIPLETSGTASTTLGAIYRQHLSKIARREFEEMIENRFVERYQLFLVPAIVLLLLPALFSRGRLVSSRRRRKATSPGSAGTAAKAAASAMLVAAVAFHAAAAPTESSRDRRALFNGAADLYSAGDYTNSAAAMRQFSLRKDMPEAMELFAASEFMLAEGEADGTNLEARISHLGESAAAFQRLLALGDGDSARLSRNLSRSASQLPALIEKRRAEEVQGKYGKVPPAALLTQMCAAQRKVSAALDSLPEPARERIAAVEALAEGESAIADMDECVQEATRQFVEGMTNENMRAAFEELFGRRAKAVASAREALEDIYVEAAREHSADSEILLFDSWKFFAEPPQFIDEAILASTNTVENAEVPRWRRRPDNFVAYEMATAFSKTFPDWAEEYLKRQAQGQQQGGSTNAPSFTEESVDEINRLTETLLFILEDGCKFDKDAAARKKSASEALPILEKIRELLPHDNQNQPSGQEGQPQGESQDKQDDGQGDQDENQGENQQDEPQEEKKEGAEEKDEPLPEDVKETLRKAIQREREHEAEKQKLRRAVPLPPSARDW